MSKLMSTLAAGSIVSINEYGRPMNYIYLAFNHYGNSENVLLREKVVGAGPILSNNAQNIYEGIGIDSYCNSAHIMRFDPVIRGSLIDTPIPIVIGWVTNTYAFNSNIKTIYRKCFPLSLKEYDNDYDGINDGGTKFSYFSAAANRIAYFEGVTSTAVPYWTRTPSFTSKNSYQRQRFYAMNEAGGGTELIMSDSYFIRPAITLNNNVLVSNSINSSGAYTIDGSDQVEEYRKINNTWKRLVC